MTAPHSISRFRRADGSLPRLAGGAPTTAEKTINDRLTEVKEQIAEKRTERAAAQQNLEAAKQAVANLGGEVSTDTPEFKAAKDARTRIDELDAEITQLRETHVGLLEIMSGAQTGYGRNQAGDLVADPTETAALTKPGAWLAATLWKHRDQVHGLPEHYKLMAAPSSLTTANVSSEAVSSVLFDILAPLSVAMAAGVETHTIDTTKTKVPRFTELPEAAWIPELGSFPKQSPGLEMVDVEPPKVGLVSPLSVEVFDDLSPLALAMVQVQIMRAVALAYDAGILFGDGEDGTPTGVANVVDEISVPFVGLRPFSDAIAQLIGENAFPGALVMNPLDLAQLFEQTEWWSSDGESNVPLWQTAIKRAANGAFALNLPFFGTPIWPTPAAPIGTALLFDPSTVLAIIRRAADIALDPFYGFDNGEVGFRCFLRGDVVVGQPNAGVKINLIPAGSS